jgi:hypothetical protein
MAQVFASLHTVNEKRISLEYGRHANTAGLYCRVPTSLVKVVEQQLAAVYPDIAIERLEEAVIAPPVGNGIYTKELWLAGDVLPVETCEAFEDRLSRELNDPLAGVLGILAAGPRVAVWSHVAIELLPASRRRVRTARRVLNRYYQTPLHSNHRRGQLFLTAATSPSLLRRAMARFMAWIYYRQSAQPPVESKAAYTKLDQPLYTARIRLTAAAPTSAAADRQLRQLAAAFAPFTINSPAEFRIVSDGGNRRGSLLSVDELAILFHPATSTVKAERMEQVASRRHEPPAALPSPHKPDSIVLGVTNFRRRQDRVALRIDDMRRHLYCCGKTGSGKSNFLLTQIVAHIAAGRGVGVIDPHGQLIEDVQRRIPRSRTNDVIVFDPAEHPIGFNPLACHIPERRPLVAAGVLTAMKKVFAVDETNAPRMLYILRNVLLALVEQPHATLLDVPRMLADDSFRRQIVNRLNDPLVRAFWQQEFAGWHDRYRTEAIAPIQNKVGQFLTSPLIRHVFAARTNSLDFRQAMDSGKIVLMNLSAGRLGEDSAALLGALLITSIEQAAKSRADISEPDRRDWFVFADEFPIYASTESLAIILSQARKYRLSLCLANQLVAQMSDELSATVFGNVGSLCVMQVGRSDAEKLADELGGDVRPEDLIALPKYHAVVRMLIDGEPTRPFTIRTLPPPAVTTRHASPDRLIRVSAKRYAGLNAATTSNPTPP